MLGTPLPDIHLLFDLVSSNDLDAIRSLLTPLTLRDRLLVVYQKVGPKTLLYRACELGFKDIVKYLLDECGADIDDGYCDSTTSLSPLRCAVKKCDIFLMFILMGRGATVQESNRSIPCVFQSYEFNSNSSILVKTLQLKHLSS